ncbi:MULTISPECIES: enoyl-CoA hydratase/isomerase family protein [Providencia]|uniref:enoyl-CoA hydratase/isomerase family protein n=1 Tax=Providencia TaxID=586 RepID=UPI0010101681|nr:MULTISPECIES: enoyl-CoA hydratase/isomerase family protein [Providencia]ELR5132117.1 enoyl-CoA hydratase/isomerase family protein [Providencia rettgeri]ELR5198459.1 enoyl-CoA hydratase/isomerase family protein [Providencia rettgeri]ELR5277226.1 enoyl-CoA hydratase/isomerase family protein [Providencia rettgeri]MBQ0316908.1 enoyl-CoA hydratase/isomerase family protein [Providencia rettgeri]MBQ0325635.1 enoyl-CoA hydratase/isomerase family protein [Providencia rettgeri]
MIIEQDFESTRLLTLDHTNKHNPFSEELENAIKHALVKAEEDSRIKSIVVYGGVGRSFSSGGDFNEVKALSGGVEVERWIDRVIDLYQAVLNVSKPTIAAIDGYAIGMGFQFAMMFDYRVMSDQAQFIMPELKHGIGCSVGAAILEFTHGHSLMKKIVFECEKLSATQCHQYHIANQVTPSSHLLKTALLQANALSKYPSAAFGNTKKLMNKSFIKVLEKTREQSKLVHKNAFATKDAQEHFQKILGKNY